MGAAAGADLPGTATKRPQLVSHCRRVRAQTLSWILTVGCTLNRNEPIRFNLSFQTGGSALAIAMPNSATCEGAAQFSKSQESVSAAFCFDLRAQSYRRDELKP